MPVEGGFIASNPAYSVVERRYVPGMYQNLALPQPEIVFDTGGDTTVELDNFARTIREQEAAETVINPDARIENTEPRMPIPRADVSDIL